MNFVSALFGGGLSAIGSTVEKVAGVFTQNKEKKAQRSQVLDVADLGYRAEVAKQAAREFTQKNNWFDSIIDGICRLPRPLFAFGAMYLCVLPVIDPIYASQVFVSFGLIPAELWYVIGGIIGFYFGFRAREKRIAGEKQIQHTEKVLGHIQKLEELKPKPKVVKKKSTRPSERPLKT